MAKDAYLRERDAARSRRNQAERQRQIEQRKHCTCRHTKARHLFGRVCDMPRCRCKEFEAA
jgi:hypothetical protein